MLSSVCVHGVWNFWSPGKGHLPFTIGQVLLVYIGHFQQLEVNMYAFTWSSHTFRCDVSMTFSLKSKSGPQADIINNQVHKRSCNLFLMFSKDVSFRTC